MTTYRIIALTMFAALTLTGCSSEYSAEVQVRHVDAEGVTTHYEVRCLQPTPEMDITVECAELYTSGINQEDELERLCEPNEGADRGVTALMQGTIDGSAVSEVFHRLDSCGIERWERLAHVLDPAGKNIIADEIFSQE